MPGLNGAAVKPRRLSNMTDMSIDTHLVQRVPTALSHREKHFEGTPPATPLSVMSELNTPTTPHGHPLRYTVQQGATPLPLLSIMPLCIARIAEGLIFGVIFRKSIWALL